MLRAIHESVFFKKYIAKDSRFVKKKCTKMVEIRPKTPKREFYFYFSES